MAAESCLLWLVFVYMCVCVCASVGGHGVTRPPLFFRQYYTSAQQHAQTPSGALSWVKKKEAGRLSAANLKEAASPRKTHCGSIPAEKEALKDTKSLTRKKRNNSNNNNSSRSRSSRKRRLVNSVFLNRETCDNVSTRPHVGGFAWTC